MNSPPIVRDRDKARALLERLETPRTFKLRRLEAYVDGTQYDGRPDFLAPDKDAPLLERKPNIVYPIVRTAIRQHLDFVLGEGRFPKISSGVAEDGTQLDDSLGLSESDSHTLDAYIAHLLEASRFQDVAQDALEQAEISGAVAVVACVRDGRFDLETHKARWCLPTFAPNGSDLVRLEIRYAYEDVFSDGHGGLRARVMMFRRVIDAHTDKVYKPARVPDDGRTANLRWTIDRERTFNHGLGFVPAVWYAFRRSSVSSGRVDGQAVHDELLDEIDALNFALSQRGRAALYSGDPQMYETGVAEGEQVAPTGAHAVIKDLGGYTVFGTSSRPRNARKKGAGTVWRYSDADAKVGMLTLPGDALAALDKHCSDLEEKINNVLGHTRISPEQVKGALSGKAIAYLYARTTSFCDRVRLDIWSGFIQPMLSLLLRMTHHIESAHPGGLYIPGARSAARVLERFSVETEDGRALWFCPHLQRQWGAYFMRTADEEVDIVQLTVQAAQSGLIPPTLALEKLRQIFPFESSNAVKTAAERELLRQVERAGAGKDDDE